MPTSSLLSYCTFAITESYPSVWLLFSSLEARRADGRRGRRGAANQRLLTVNHGAHRQPNGQLVSRIGRDGPARPYMAYKRVDANWLRAAALAAYVPQQRERDCSAREINAANTESPDRVWQVGAGSRWRLYFARSANVWSLDQWLSRIDRSKTLTVPSRFRSDTGSEVPHLLSRMERSVTSTL